MDKLSAGTVRLNINTKPKYTARMQRLWLRVDMCGFCIGAAYWPLLLIHSVMCSVTGAVAKGVRVGCAGRHVRLGGNLLLWEETLHIT